jgi:hypothetical protein
VVCIVVRKKGAGWERIGLLKIGLGEYERERALEAYASRMRKSFTLM